MYQYRPADTDVWVQTQMFGCTHSHTHIRKERERERSAVSHGCELPLQKIPPHLLLSPPPHLASIIPVFSKQLRWQREAKLAKWRQTGAQSAASSGCPPRLPTDGTVSRVPHVHTPFVHGAGRERCGEGVGGGWSTGTSTVELSAFHKEGWERSLAWKTLHGRR